MRDYAHAPGFTLTCRRCGGSGIVAHPICRRGSDHAGHDCDGRVCGLEEEDCRGCRGTGEVEG